MISKIKLLLDQLPANPYIIYCVVRSKRQATMSLTVNYMLIYKLFFDLKIYLIKFFTSK